MFFGKSAARLFEIGLDVLRLHEIAFDLLHENLLQVLAADAVAALLAGVFGGAHGDIHFGSTVTGHKAAEDVRGQFGRPPLAFHVASVQAGVAPLPKLGGDDGLHFIEDVLALRLYDELFTTLSIGGVVSAVDALGCGVAELEAHGGIRPLFVVPGAVASGVQHPGHGLDALVLIKKFIDQPANGSLLRMHRELFILPHVAVGGFAAEGLAHLGADENRAFDAVGDLLALPLGHAAHQIEKQPPGG